MERERHLILIYQQKETAPTSYYLQEGEKGYLPARVCFTQRQFAEVHSGSHLNPAGQFKATFKLSESSQYRKDTRTLHSNIYPVNIPLPGIIGTGDIKGTDDLLIFEDRSGGTWRIIAIHIFPGCKFKAAEIISSLNKKSPCD